MYNNNHPIPEGEFYEEFQDTEKDRKVACKDLNAASKIGKIEWNDEIEEMNFYEHADGPVLQAAKGNVIGIDTSEFQDETRVGVTEDGRLVEIEKTQDEFEDIKADLRDAFLDTYPGRFMIWAVEKLSALLNRFNKEIK